MKKENISIEDSMKTEMINNYLKEATGLCLASKYLTTIHSLRKLDARYIILENYLRSRFSIYSGKIYKLLGDLNIDGHQLIENIQNFYYETLLNKDFIKEREITEIVDYIKGNEIEIITSFLHSINKSFKSVSSLVLYIVLNVDKELLAQNENKKTIK